MKKKTIVLSVIAALIILIALGLFLFHPFGNKQIPVPINPFRFKPIPVHPCITWHGLWPR